MTTFKKLFVGVVAAFAMFAFASSASAAYTHTGLLKQGMTSPQVLSLQQTLNTNGFLVSAVGAGSPGMETMYFGGKTKSAVMAFQSAKGLKADGIVGVQTGTALAALTGGSVTYPAGCSSTTGYSTTTGLPCSQAANLPAGCTSTSGYSTTTGQACSGGATLPAGCISTAGYSPTTGQKCDSSTGSNNNGPLSGGAGYIETANTSADVKASLNQGDSSQKVAAVRVTARGGDVSLSNVKVALANFSGTGSDRIDRYVGNVSVWLDGNKVGSANISDFYREGSPYMYSNSIALSNAVIRANQSANLYVAVDVNSVISGSGTASANDLGATVDAAIYSIRYTDATGAILSVGNASVTKSGTDFSGQLSNQSGFTFNASGSSADAKLSLSSSNPVAMTVEVKKTATSSSYKVLSLNLRNDSSATSSVKINRIPVTLTVAGGTASTNTDNLINDVKVNINGTDYWATKSSSTAGTLNGSGAGSVDYLVDMNNNGISLNPGQSANVDVYVTFRQVNSNYPEGATVTASVDASKIDAETSNADVTVSGGTITGSAMTLRATGASFNANTKTVTVSGDDTQTGTFAFNITANPFDGSVYIPVAGASAVSYDVVDASTGNTVSTGSKSVSVVVPGANMQVIDTDGSSGTTNVNTYVVNSNQSITVTVTFTPATGTSGQYYVRINNLKVFTDSAEGSQLNTIPVDSSSFQTNPVSLKAA